MDSRQRTLAAVRPHGRTGVELGPLDRPLVHRGDGDILYADHLSTDDLARKYAGHAAAGPRARGALVEVDLVLDRQTLAQALGDRGPVDYIVASHVIEHLPDPVGWLRDCAEALHEDGLLFLAVPDMRFTFDRGRTLTSVGDLVGASLTRPTGPSPAQVYEHFSRAVQVDAKAVWAGRETRFPLFTGHGPEAGLEHARRIHEAGGTIDVHCSVFTPDSFVSVLGEVIAIGLVPFAFAEFTPTQPGEIEFFALLRKCEGLAPAKRAAFTSRSDRPAPRPAAPGWRSRLSSVRRLGDPR
nr:class I SAM-dependent methyltransferase [Methylobacterium sp. OTU13CASTA1]